jgi:anti-sigma B factor antagonist
VNTTGSLEPADADELVVQRTESGSEVVLKLVGELDVAGVDRVEHAATNLPPHAHVTVDLSDLEFMDSSGIRVLMNLDLRSRNDKWTLTLRSPQPQVLRILHLCGFQDRFEFTE